MCEILWEEIRLHDKKHCMVYLRSLYPTGSLPPSSHIGMQGKQGSIPGDTVTDQQQLSPCIVSPMPQMGYLRGCCCCRSRDHTSGCHYSERHCSSIGWINRQQNFPGEQNQNPILAGSVLWYNPEEVCHFTSDYPLNVLISPYLFIVTAK